MASSLWAWVKGSGAVAIAGLLVTGGYQVGLTNGKLEWTDKESLLRDQVSEARSGKLAAETNYVTAESARQALRAQLDSLIAANASLEARAGAADVVRYVASENAKLEAQMERVRRNHDWSESMFVNDPQARQRQQEDRARLDAEVLRLTQQMTSNMALLRQCD